MYANKQQNNAAVTMPVMEIISLPMMLELKQQLMTTIIKTAAKTSKNCANNFLLKCRRDKNLII